MKDLLLDKYFTYFLQNSIEKNLSILIHMLWRFGNLNPSLICMQIRAKLRDVRFSSLRQITISSSSTLIILLLTSIAIKIPYNVKKFFYNINYNKLFGG